MDKKRKEIELPVYKASYDLLINSYKLLENVKRDYKYTVGEELKKEIIFVNISIYRANKTKMIKDKVTYVTRALESIEVVRVLFRLLKDLYQITFDSHIKINVLIENVRRQLIAWEKFLLKEARVLDDNFV